MGVLRAQLQPPWFCQRHGCGVAVVVHERVELLDAGEQRGLLATATVAAPGPGPAAAPAGSGHSRGNRASAPGAGRARRPARGPGTRRPARNASKGGHRVGPELGPSPSDSDAGFQPHLAVPLQAAAQPAGSDPVEDNTPGGRAARARAAEHAGRQRRIPCSRAATMAGCRRRPTGTASSGFSCWRMSLTVPTRGQGAGAPAQRRSAICCSQSCSASPARETGLPRSKIADHLAEPPHQRLSCGVMSSFPPCSMMRNTHQG